MWKSYNRRKVLKRLGAAGALGSVGLLGGCAVEEYGVGLGIALGIGAGTRTLPGGEEIAENPLDTTPANQAATFRNIDRLSPTRVIRRGEKPLPLPEHKFKLGSFTYEHEGKQYTVDEYMSRNRTTGLLILKGGEISFERYAMGNDASSRWTSFSVAKSVTSTLVGAALKDGSIVSLDDNVAKYVAALNGSAFGETPLRDLLNMTSGVRWTEDYSIFHESEIVRFERAISLRKAGAVMELMRTRKRAAAPGTVFNYSTGDSYVLGAVVASATGHSLSDYLSMKIWARLGMETDGYWLLDAPNGLETGGDNFSATLRDYARFGQFFLREGVIGDEALLPTGWRDMAGRSNSPLTACGLVDPDDPLGFGMQWWVFPTGADAMPFHDGAFTSEGIFGQFIYINPKEDMVVVVWSAWRSPWKESAETETISMIGAAAAGLR